MRLLMKKNTYATSDASLVTNALIRDQFPAQSHGV